MITKDKRADYRAKVARAIRYEARAIIEPTDLIALLDMADALDDLTPRAADPKSEPRRPVNHLIVADQIEAFIKSRSVVDGPGGRINIRTLSEMLARRYAAGQTPFEEGAAIVPRSEIITEAKRMSDEIAEAAHIPGVKDTDRVRDLPDVVEFTIERGMTITLARDAIVTLKPDEVFALVSDEAVIREADVRGYTCIDKARGTPVPEIPDAAPLPRRCLLCQGTRLVPVEHAPSLEPGSSPPALKGYRCEDCGAFNSATIPVGGDRPS